MNLYRILKNGILSRREKTGIIEDSSIVKPVVCLKKEEEISFSSSDIVSLVDDSILDTNDPMTVAKYKSNLRNLISDAKSRGEISRFRLIREDDFFPYDWKWRVNSRETCREYAKSKIAYTLRMEEARRRLFLKKNVNTSFGIPFSQEEEYEEASHLDPRYGQIYEPVKFRSTKHYTINTPLSYTGAYNQVRSNRNFVVIDTPNEFCASGYGYSADFQDAYLDMTHESLPISTEAVVLIEESRYPEVLKDERVRKQLNDRRVILYRGDEATAINMVLSQEGVLPYRMGRFMQFDSELEEIMVRSMKNFCARNHLAYSHNHGNMFGRGGHFSDLLDSENREREEFEKEFCTFFQQANPDQASISPASFFESSERIISSVGAHRVFETVNAYNEWARKDEVSRLAQYDQERGKVTPEIHTLFLDTIELVRNYYQEKKENPYMDYPEELHQAILKFFHSPLVMEQVEFAKKIQSYLKTVAKKLS